MSRMSSKKARSEKGAARIQQLVEQFPDLPRLQVLAADFRTEGLRHTAGLDHAGRWAWPDAHDHYEYDYDEHKPEELDESGVTRTPKFIFLGKGRGFQTILDSRSPYEVKYEGGGVYQLYRDGDAIEEVHFPPRPEWFWKKTSSGKAMNQVVHTPFERAFSVYDIAYCEYFKDGNQCLFCNLNPTLEHFAAIRGEKTPMKREQDVYETYLAFAPETGVDSVGVAGGGFYDRKKEADQHIRFIKVLKRAMQDSGIICPDLSVLSQVMEAEDYLRFKEAGVTTVLEPMEVWDPKLFPIICPGKAKNVGREHYIECLLEAVEIFGWGKVRTSFVVGVELAPPHGFKTEDEGFASVLEGTTFWASHGVPLLNIALRTNPGSMLSGAKRPRTEYILRLERERDKLHKEYRLV